MREHTSTRTRGAVATGAVVVNAALVAPLLVLIVLGIVEMASLMKDNVALSSLVRQGGRAAATSLAAEGGETPELADVTAVAVERAESALSRDSISELWIYKADSAGFPAANPSGDHFGSCVTDCLVYTWDSTDQTFHYAGGHLDADDIDSCSADVGVYMKASHEFLTGVFSRSVDISKHQTFRLAERAGSSCVVVTS